MLKHCLQTPLIPQHKEDITMKKYYNPEIEMIVLTSEDILTASLTKADMFDMGAVEGEDLWTW